MIDTIKIYYQFNHKKDFYYSVQCLNDTLIKAGKKLHPNKNDKNTLVTYAFAELGFEEIMMRDTKKGYHAIEIKLRPKLLVEKNNYINVLLENEVKIARKQFNYILKHKLKLSLPDFFTWKVKRIDYAIDIKVNQKLMPAYMILFSKGNIPAYAFKDTVTEEYINETNNCYIRCKGYTINFYDRFTTLKDKQKKTKKFYQNIDAAKEHMRLEIQVNVDSYKLKKKKIIKENTVGEFFRIKLCKYFIQHHFNAIVGNGDYYSLEKAKSILFDKANSLPLAFQLKKILELIHTKGSIYKAKEKYIRNEDEPKKAARKFSEYINVLRNFGINPVTLTDELTEVLQDEHLKGLTEKVNEQFKQCRAVIIPK